MSQDILLPQTDFTGEKTLCLVGELTKEEIFFFGEDREISEKREYFSVLSRIISEEKQLVGIYADEFCWECVFDEFEEGVMANYWKDKFQRVCQLK